MIAGVRRNEGQLGQRASEVVESKCTLVCLLNGATNIRTRRLTVCFCVFAWQGRLRQLLEDLRHGIDSREDVLKEIWFFARDCERRAEAKAQQAAGSGSGAAGSGGGGSGFGHHGSGALDTSSLADELEIVFPGGLVSADAARHALLSFVLDRRDFHRQYVWYSTAMLPVSTLAGALPGYVCTTAVRFAQR